VVAVKVNLVHEKGLFFVNQIVGVRKQGGFSDWRCFISASFPLRFRFISASFPLQFY
jgi:hypothetical protein